MGKALQKYQSGNLDNLDQIKLKADCNLYNYSQLSIQNNPRLEIMYAK